MNDSQVCLNCSYDVKSAFEAIVHPVLNEMFHIGSWPLLHK